MMRKLTSATCTHCGQLLSEVESGLNWHGWPPQVWNGKRWVYVAPAKIMAEQAEEIRRLKHRIWAKRAKARVIHVRRSGAMDNDRQLTGGA
jgi:hypothetical protein